MSEFNFEEFPKIPRFKREVVVTEKLDGTNAQITLFPLDSEAAYAKAAHNDYLLTVLPGLQNGDTAFAVFAGSRNRWLKAEKKADNFGFAAWVWDHKDELRSLGEGRHFGEWYGAGIQRGYGLDHKRFALFNVARWNAENPNRPACCEVVPILARGEDVDTDEVMEELHTHGSTAAPWFMKPEGIVVFHTASRQLYKRTFDQDGGKWKVAA